MDEFFGLNLLGYFERCKSSCPCLISRWTCVRWTHRCEGSHKNEYFDWFSDLRLLLHLSLNRVCLHHQLNQDPSSHLFRLCHQYQCLLGRTYLFVIIQCFGLYIKWLVYLYSNDLMLFLCLFILLIQASVFFVCSLL